MSPAPVLEGVVLVYAKGRPAEVVAETALRPDVAEVRAQIHRRYRQAVTLSPFVGQAGAWRARVLTSVTARRSSW